METRGCCMSNYKTRKNRQGAICTAFLTRLSLDVHKKKSAGWRDLLSEKRERCGYSMDTVEGPRVVTIRNLDGLPAR